MTLAAARVFQAAYACHPESKRDLLRITVDQAYASGGVTGHATDLWCERDAPIPVRDETVEWDHKHVLIGDKPYKKLENDSVSF